MSIDIAELNEMLSHYKSAVEEWIMAIRHEEELASANSTEADVDEWEGAGFQEEKARSKAKQAKKAYEDALRQKFFNF